MVVSSSQSVNIYSSSVFAIGAFCLSSAVAGDDSIPSGYCDLGKGGCRGADGTTSWNSLAHPYEKDLAACIEKCNYFYLADSAERICVGVEYNDHSWRCNIQGNTPIVTSSAAAATNITTPTTPESPPEPESSPPCSGSVCGVCTRTPDPPPPTQCPDAGSCWQEGWAPPAAVVDPECTCPGGLDRMVIGYSADERDPKCYECAHVNSKPPDGPQTGDKINSGGGSDKGPNEQGADAGSNGEVVAGEAYDGSSSSSSEDSHASGGAKQGPGPAIGAASAATLVVLFGLALLAYFVHFKHRRGREELHRTIKGAADLESISDMTVDNPRFTVTESRRQRHHAARAANPIYSGGDSPSGSDGGGEGGDYEIPNESEYATADVTGGTTDSHVGARPSPPPPRFRSQGSVMDGMHTVSSLPEYAEPVYNGGSETYGVLDGSGSLPGSSFKRASDAAAAAAAGSASETQVVTYAIYAEPASVNEAVAVADGATNSVAGDGAAASTGANHADEAIYDGGSDYTVPVQQQQQQGAGGVGGGGETSVTLNIEADGAHFEAGYASSVTEPLYRPVYESHPLQKEAATGAGGRDNAAAMVAVGGSGIYDVVDQLQPLSQADTADATDGSDTYAAIGQQAVKTGEVLYDVTLGGAAAEGASVGAGAGAGAGAGGSPSTAAAANDVYAIVNKHAVHASASMPPLEHGSNSGGSSGGSGDGEEDVYESIAYGNLQGNDAGIDTYGELNSTSMSTDETATPRQSQTLLVAHEDVL
eukprot:gene14007-2050_t